ncbi:type VI secretion system ATPase TssH [Rhodopirellula sp. MGV]|uniref:type VI secretion system ATPase TssH n=1 Tax=Rhodopirellula sp. MGV TaxID=2023130 RepID=UPI000B95F7A2|nr:type VI secretion system ATPase TssH [Rhodopirellula sp. MGV]OYP35480.1 ClpV1 family T6SS ATPase [Rhodopirellula sp. MGV]PNY33922.1 type VI secretion system ATPase TssH [Rhodopirellula baltica]
MAQINLKELVGKLNDTCRGALESAAGLCLSRTNYNIEIEHWLLKLLENSRSDLSVACAALEINTSDLQNDLNKAIDKFKTGNGRPPALSPNVVDLIREAWLYSSVDHGAAKVRSGHLLVALLTSSSLRSVARDASDALAGINADSLAQDFAGVLADSEETDVPMGVGKAPASSSAAPGKPGVTKTPALDQFTIDLTDRAQSGHIDPVLGRDPEIRQLIDILTRRRQNNPILTGEAGVGKTAVVEGFALRVAAGDVPEAIRNIRIHTLDLGLLQAGAGMKGEFENRLRGVIDEVKASPVPIVLFIDEAHTLIGAGGQAGQGDAANLLKPALARGELRTIAATTWAEYKKYFEKDAALARRFQTVIVNEPDEPVAVEMMRGLVGTLESHHRVRIMNEAVIEAVKLSKRYISGRQLPDKAVSLLDTACARIQLSQSSTPPAIEDAQRRLSQLEVSIRILKREQQTGADHGEAIEAAEAEIVEVEKELESLRKQWDEEKQHLDTIVSLRKKLDKDAPEHLAAPPVNETADAESESAADSAETPTEEEPPTEEQIAQWKSELVAAEAELRKVQGERPLLFPAVDAGAIAETVAAWTGIPVGRMVSNEINTVLQLKELMEQSIVGQSHGLDRIAQSIRTSRAGLRDPRTPIGVFLLAGTSGVGKTETAITLANLLYGGEQNMTTINMSEFKEEHKVSLLMGSPPGYVGYGEGGVLTEAVRRKPYSVVLLDEVEKAHPGVQDVFYQVFDKGQMKDGEGRDIDFKNTVIIMTTNAGTDLIKSLCADEDTMPDPDGFIEAVFPELLKTFKPAFLGRVSVIPYYPLNDDVMSRIIRLKLGKVGRRVAESYGAEFEYTDAVVDSIRSRCTEVDTGARNIDHILNRTMLPELSSRVLSSLAEGETISKVSIDMKDDHFEYQVISEQ